MKTVLSLVILAISQNAFADSISIDSNCYFGLITSNIEAKVDGQKFNFSAGCEFYLNETFKTKKGTRCEISSGMCNFAPEGQLRIDCTNGYNDRVYFQCPSEDSVQATEQ